MMRSHARGQTLLAAMVLCASLTAIPDSVRADPSKYPQFAQQTLPANIVPELINVEELVAELRAGVKPLIIDVRTEKEFRETHIVGAASVPLGEFKDYLKSIPRDRLIVLY